jgi:hypothetical protein
MHLLFEGVSIWMFKHWNGVFFSNSDLNRPDDNSYILSKKVWEAIGETMEANRKAIPTEFGRAPINIARYSNGFKAEEWTNWTNLYSLPLLANYQQDKR